MSVNFLQYIRPMHYVSQFFGISFYSLPEYETSDCGEEIFNFIIGLAVVCLYLYCSCHALYHITKLKSGNKNISGDFVKIVGVIYILQFVISSIYNIIYRNKIKSLMYLIHERITINYDKKRNIIILKIVLILSFFCSLFLMDIHSATSEGLSFFIVIRFSVYFNLFNVFQHVTIMTEIRNEFATINDSLLQFKISAAHKHANKVEKPYRFSRIAQLAKSHQMISEVSNSFCDTLGMKVLTQIAFYFLLLVFSTSPMVRICKNKDSDIADLKWLIVGIIRCAMFMTAIAGICYIYNAVMQEERKTSLIVHEFWNEHVEEYSIFKIDEFQSISLQMLHGKLQFTACGLFNLDFSFFHTVIAALATYMVILNQFDDMSK